MTTLKLKTDLNCGGCVSKVQPLLDNSPFVKSWQVDTNNPDKVLTLQGTNQLNPASVDALLNQVGFHVLGKASGNDPEELTSLPFTPEPETKTSAFPVLLIVGMITGAVGLVEFSLGTFDPMRAMRHFMGAFFLTFAFFKWLNLSKFADAFSQYDLLAKVSRPYALAYPSIETIFGFWSFANVAPVTLNLLMLVIMFVGSVGVIRSLIQKKKVQCACLGTVIQLPMSWVTLVEDLGMGVLAAIMLAMLLM